MTLTLYLSNWPLVDAVIVEHVFPPWQCLVYWYVTAGCSDLSIIVYFSCKRKFVRCMTLTLYLSNWPLVDAVIVEHVFPPWQCRVYWCVTAGCSDLSIIVYFSCKRKFVWYMTLTLYLSNWPLVDAVIVEHVFPPWQCLVYWYVTAGCSDLSIIVYFSCKRKFVRCMTLTLYLSNWPLVDAVIVEHVFPPWQCRVYWCVTAGCSDLSIIVYFSCKRKFVWYMTLTLYLSNWPLVDAASFHIHKMIHLLEICIRNYTKQIVITKEWLAKVDCIYLWWHWPLTLTEFNWIATPSPNCVGNPGWHRTRKPLAYRVSCYTHSPQLNIPRSFKIVIYLILEHIYTSSINTFPWQSIPFIYRSLRKCILSYV